MEVETNSIAPPEEGLWTVEQTRKFLSLSTAMVYVLMDRGELPFVRFGRARRIQPAAMRELIARCRRQSETVSNT
jgi:excisionase family DNA binding protein